jgi:CBS domain containing-hemolysin-like protein
LPHRPAASLRESLEEAFEEHEGEAPAAEDLDAEERAMLRRMLVASEQRAGDIATPRADIEALSMDVSFADAVRIVRDSGHSRLPVFRGSLDDVAGMLHMKDLFERIAGTEPWPQSIDGLVRPVLFVPPGKPVLDLLADMRKARTHMAIIVDEFGGTDGLVTIEDIVEEIVGEIEDEHDEEEAALLQPAPGGAWLAEARLPLETLEELLDTSFSDADLAEDVDTLGGLAVVLAGRVPMPGERLTHPNGWTLEILAGDDRRIERLRLVPPSTEEVEEA